MIGTASGQIYDSEFEMLAEQWLTSSNKEAKADFGVGLDVTQTPASRVAGAFSTLAEEGINTMEPMDRDSLTYAKPPKEKEKDSPTSNQSLLNRELEDIGLPPSKEVVPLGGVIKDLGQRTRERIFMNDIEGIRTGENEVVPGTPVPALDRMGWNYVAAMEGRNRGEPVIPALEQDRVLGTGGRGGSSPRQTPEEYGRSILEGLRSGRIDPDSVFRERMAYISNNHRPGTPEYRHARDMISNSERAVNTYLNERLASLGINRSSPSQPRTAPKRTDPTGEEIARLMERRLSLPSATSKEVEPVKGPVNVKEVKGNLLGERKFEFWQEHGKVGQIRLTEQDGGKHLHVEYVNAGKKDPLLLGSPNSVGPGIVRSVIKQIKEIFPNAETISGFRISGARGANTGIAREPGKWIDQNQEIRLRKPTKP